MDDDFEIEITDLWGGPAGPPGTQARPLRLEGADAPAAEQRVRPASATRPDAPVTPSDDDDDFAMAIEDLRAPPDRQAGTAPATLSAPDESLDLEVTDLRGQPVRATHWLADLTGPDSALGTLVARAWHRVGAVGLTASAPHAQSGLLAPVRRANRRRLAGGLAALGAVATALILVLGGGAKTGALVNTLFATPTATALGANTLDLVNTVPWGHLTIDGRKASVVANSIPEIVQLAGGQHQLEYDAPPFPRLRCQVTVPAASADTCPVTDAPQSWGSDNGGAARVLDMGALVSNLPPDQLNQLAFMVQSLLDSRASTTMLAPGDHYMEPDDQVATAQSPLLATIRTVLNTDPNAGPSVTGFVCLPFCDGQTGQIADYSSPNGWTLQANAQVQWVITTSDRKVVDTIPIAIAGAQRTSAPDAALITLPLTVTWNGGWQPGARFALATVDPVGTGAFGSELCNVAQQLIGMQASSTSSPSVADQCALIGNPVDGCLVQWQPTDVNGNNVGPPAYLLFRFGVLLTANQVAMALFPGLTVAGNQEQALAQQIATANGPPPPVATPIPVTTAVGVTN